MIKEKIKSKIKITERSTLIIKNYYDKIKDHINIDGTLVIDDNKLNLREKEYLTYVSLKPNEGEEYERIRGFKIIILKE